MTTKPLPSRLLIVEDEAIVARDMARALDHLGYTVVATVGDGDAALAAAAEHRPDLVLMDITIPGPSDGIATALEIRRRCGIPAIYVTAHSDQAVLERAVASAPYGYVVKPFTDRELHTSIQVALARHELERQATRHSEELERYAAELEQRNRELDAFAHTVAHDLKNPLGVVMGYADYLLTWPAIREDPDIEKSMETVSESSHAMHDIVESLLLLAAVRQGDAPRVELDMPDVVSRAVSQVDHLVTRHKATIAVGNVDAPAVGHPGWVQQVWVNLLSNAIKYGGLSPVITVSSCARADGQVRFYVRDRGPGIASKKIERLFQPFDRLDATRGPGHGLGLSIVERIVHKLGGEVGVESTGVPGQGALFWFTLPTP